MNTQPVKIGVGTKLPIGIVVAILPDGVLVKSRKAAANSRKISFSEAEASYDQDTQASR